STRSKAKHRLRLAMAKDLRRHDAAAVHSVERLQRSSQDNRRRQGGARSGAVFHDTTPTPRPSDSLHTAVGRPAPPAACLICKAATYLRRREKCETSKGEGDDQSLRYVRFGKLLQGAAAAGAVEDAISLAGSRQRPRGDAHAGISGDEPERQGADDRALK